MHGFTCVLVSLALDPWQRCTSRWQGSAVSRPSATRRGEATHHGGVFWGLPGDLGKETLPRTNLLAGRNKDMRRTCSLVGEKPGRREESRHQDQNT